jgi:hypothetical protein
MASLMVISEKIMVQRCYTTDLRLRTLGDR